MRLILYIIKNGDIMKWNLNYIQKNAKPSFTFNENIEFEQKLVDKITGLDHLKSVNVKGTLKYLDSIAQCIIDYEVSGIMEMRCAITNEKVDYKFKDEDTVSFKFINDDDDEVIFAKGNTVDLTPSVWQLIVVNVPLKVVKEGAKLENKSGKNWQIGQNIEKNEPKEKSIDPRLESLKNYFDKQ